MAEPQTTSTSQTAPDDGRLTTHETTPSAPDSSLAPHEASLASDRKGDESKEAEKPQTLTESASAAAASAASTASTTAANMKDNVFSMFGGGQKKEKKEEEEVDEPSGSSKAKKEAEDEVSSEPV